MLMSHSNSSRFELRPTIYKNKEISDYDQSIYRWLLGFETFVCECELCKRLVLGLDQPGFESDWLH